jgi:hypothetical protein
MGAAGVALAAAAHVVVGRLEDDHGHDGVDDDAEPAIRMTMTQRSDDRRIGVEHPGHATGNTREHPVVRDR